MEPTGRGSAPLCAINTKGLHIVVCCKQNLLVCCRYSPISTTSCQCMTDITPCLSEIWRMTEQNQPKCHKYSCAPGRQTSESTDTPHIQEIIPCLWQALLLTRQLHILQCLIVLNARNTTQSLSNPLDDQGESPRRPQVFFPLYHRNSFTFCTSQKCLVC